MAVAIVMVLVTLTMGFGLRRLDFATGQDSYIDPASQVANDNERYQRLFGGESMVVLFTADAGKTVVDLSAPANVASSRRSSRPGIPRASNSASEVPRPSEVNALPAASATRCGVTQSQLDAAG